MADAVRATSYGSDHMELSGLLPDEVEVLRGFLLGASWVRTTDEGRIEKCDRFASLPSPIDDPMLSSFWSNDPKQGPANAEDWLEPQEGWHSPGIIIQHLGGYDRGVDTYKRTAERLERYGFECLRSRRGVDGRYWEVWLLPYLLAARNELKDAIGETKDWREATAKAVSFLCRNARFGTLDVSVQRAAMVIE